MASPAGLRYLAVGATHRTAPLSFRERLAPDDAAAPLLAGLAGAGVRQALALATCDRVEVFAMTPDPVAEARRIADVLAERSGCAGSEIDAYARTLIDEAAARHLPAVAAGLDSLVLGEPEVFGQVKAAEGHARAAGLVGSELGQWIQATFRIAKRVRTETAIGARPVSLAAAALGIARRVHGDLGQRAGLVVGAGEAAELVANALRAGGLTRIAVTHPTERRVAGLAQRLGANVRSFERLDLALADADIVVTALGTGRVVLTARDVATALRSRRRRPIFIVDLAVPPDVDAAVDALDDVFVYRLDDLERVAEEGLSERRQAAEAAWAIVDEGVAELMRAGAERAAVPAVVGLRRAFEGERDRLLAEQPGLDAATATRLLVQRLLHGPSTTLRVMAGDGEDVGTAEALLKRLFEGEEP